MRACRPHCRPSVSCLPPPERSRPVPPSAEEYVPPPTRLPYRDRQPNPTTVHKLVGAAAAAVLCKFSTATCTAWEGGRSKRGGGGSRNVVPPSFSSIPTCRRRGAGIARHAARGSGSGSGSGNIPPMYNVSTRSMCLAWVGLDWAGWDHTTTTTTTPTNCEARNESFLVIPGG